MAKTLSHKRNVSEKLLIENCSVKWQKIFIDEKLIFEAKFSQKHN